MNKTIDLRPKTPNLRKVKVGTIVISSKGFKFKLMSRKAKKECWLDCTSKVIWHDMEDEIYTHYKAVEKFGGSLPTIQEFQEAEKHGFREVLPNMNYWFWSASLCPDSSDVAQIFDGRYGGSDVVFRDVGFLSVRCVGR